MDLRFLRLDAFLGKMAEIAKNSEKSADKIEANLQKISETNERIGTLFRLHDDNKRRIERLEERDK